MSDIWHSHSNKVLSS